MTIPIAPDADLQFHSKQIQTTTLTLSTSKHPSHSRIQVDNSSTITLSHSSVAQTSKSRSATTLSKWVVMIRYLAKNIDSRTTLLVPLSNTTTMRGTWLVLSSCNQLMSALFSTTCTQVQTALALQELRTSPMTIQKISTPCLSSKMSCSQSLHPSQSGRLDTRLTP